jgi:hypothetical protein
MKLACAVLSAACILSCVAAPLRAQSDAKPPARPPLKLGDVEYLHRWSQNTQHEYTPADQADLEHWRDMLTINYYPSVTDGDGLAAAANGVLENYKRHKAQVVRTNSVPRTPDKPAEHLIVVLFAQPAFIEAVFARFKLVNGVGTAAIYSHRVYGQKVGPEMSAWLEPSGPQTEQTLMSWEGIPAYAADKK